MMIISDRILHGFVYRDYRCYFYLIVTPQDVRASFLFSTGPGAEAREAIGWVMFGGLGLAALFTLFLTPVVYLAIGRFHKPRSVENILLQGELEAARFGRQG